MSKVTHLYYIPLGAGYVVGYEVRCENCRTVWPLQGSPYRCVSYIKDRPLSELIQQTHPDLPAKYAAWTELGQQRWPRRLTAQERATLLHEIFILFNGCIWRRAAAVSLDRKSGPALLASFVLGVPSGYVLRAAHLVPEHAAVYVSLGAVLVGLLTTLVILAGDVRRFVRRRVEPALVRALAPLQPGLDELEAALHELRSSRTAVGRKVNARRLHAALEAASIDGAFAGIDAYRY